MDVQRCYSLNDEQALALLLYSKEKDKEWPLDCDGKRPRSISVLINTSHPISGRLYDIAGDFDRYVGKDNLLAECYDTAREAIYGER